MSFSSLVKATALAAFATLAVAGPIHTAADSIVLQAEDAKLTGLTVSSKYNGYTGTGYVEGFDSPSARVTFAVEAPAQGVYDFSIYHGGAFGDGEAAVTVNQGESSANFKVAIPPADLWATSDAPQVALNQGANTIDIMGSSGNFYIDSITLTPA